MPAGLSAVITLNTTDPTATHAGQEDTSSTTYVSLSLALNLLLYANRWLSSRHYRYFARNFDDCPACGAEMLCAAKEVAQLIGSDEIENDSRPVTFHCYAGMSRRYRLSLTLCSLCLSFLHSLSMSLSFYVSLLAELALLLISSLRLLLSLSSSTLAAVMMLRGDTSNLEETLQKIREARPCM